MKKLLLIFIFIISLPQSFAQIITVKGRVVDYNNAPIKSVKIIYGSQLQDYITTNSDGYYSFKYNKMKLDTVFYKHSAYENKIVIIDKRKLKKIQNNILIVNVTLNDNVLGVIEIKAKPPKIVVGNPLYSIADYEYTKNGGLLLLTYAKNQKKGSKLRLLNKDLKEITAYNFNEQTVELTTDFRKNIHLITKQNVYLVITVNNRIQIYKEDKSYYYKFLSPVVDTLNDRLYYSNYSEIYPAFDYIEFNKTDSAYKTMLKVKNEPLMEQYRAEFKFSDVRTQLWAHNKQIETGIDKEVWVGAALFTKSVYYTPLYAPLFVQNDSVLIFDHYANKMYKYTPTKGIIDSLSIDYHFGPRKSGWEQPLIQDKQANKIYVVFMRNGYTFLSLINTNTGKIIKSRKLYYKYIEQIKVINNEVYYIYRPYESVQKKYIYKEKL